MFYPGPGEDLAEFFGTTFAVRTVPHHVRLDRREVQVFSLTDDPHHLLLAKRLTRELECYQQPRPVGSNERQHGWLPVEAERIASWLRGRMYLASRTNEAWAKDTAVAWDEYLSVAPSGSMHEVDVGDESAQARMRVIHVLMDGYREYLDRLEQERLLSAANREGVHRPFAALASEIVEANRSDALNPTREVSFAFDRLFDQEPSEPEDDR